jgi:hypothetical protein
MGLFSRLAGTITTFFQFGGPGGPGINQNGAALEVKNSTNAAFAITRGATPVAANDYATKAYVDGASPAGASDVIVFAVGTATASSVTSIPNNAIILRATLLVTTPYSGGATISIGNAGTPAELQATTDNDPQVNGTYDAPQQTTWTGPAIVQATVAGGPAAGASSVMVEYVVTPNP